MNENGFIFSETILFHKYFFSVISLLFTTVIKLKFVTFIMPKYMYASRQFAKV